MTHPVRTLPEGQDFNEGEASRPWGKGKGTLRRHRVLCGYLTSCILENSTFPASALFVSLARTQNPMALIG